VTVTHLPVPEPDDDAPRGLTPPHDLNAEQSVLGAALISRPALADLVDLGLRARDFYRPAHELIWAAILHLHDSGQPVDVVTVSAALQAAGELRRVGGPVVVHDLSAAVPSPASAVHYAGIVQERAVSRALVSAGQKITHLGYAQDGGDVDEIVHAAQSEVAAVAERRAGPGGEVDMDAALDELITELEEGAGTVVPTGIRPLVPARLSGRPRLPCPSSSTSRRAAFRSGSRRWR
jgi:replicative DNA helicase